jgi:hypothetical protein
MHVLRQLAYIHGHGNAAMLRSVLSCVPLSSHSFHSFIHFIHSFIYFIHSFISFIHLFIRSFIHSSDTQIHGVFAGNTKSFRFAFVVAGIKLRTHMGNPNFSNPVCWAFAATCFFINDDAHDTHEKVLVEVGTLSFVSKSRNLEMRFRMLGACCSLRFHP